MMQSIHYFQIIFKFMDDLTNRENNADIVELKFIMSLCLPGFFLYEIPCDNFLTLADYLKEENKQEIAFYYINAITAKLMQIELVDRAKVYATWSAAKNNVVGQYNLGKLCEDKDKINCNKMVYKSGRAGTYGCTTPTC